MTVGELIQTVDVMDHSSDAKHSDGSSIGDEFQFIVFLDGHGKLTEATVNKVALSRGAIFVRASGPETSGKERIDEL